MPRITQAKALEGYRLDLTFDDGVRGVADVSGLVGKGVFAIWRDPGAFRDVGIGDSGELVWGDEADLCPDALYCEVTGKSPEDLFPRLKGLRAHA